MRLVLDLALVLVDHLAVGRGGLGADGRLGQHGADGLDRLAALVHLLEGLLGVVGVDRVARLVDVLEDLGHQQRGLPPVLLAQLARGLARHLGAVAALGAEGPDDGLGVLGLVLGGRCGGLLLPPRRPGDDHEGHQARGHRAATSTADNDHS